MRSFPSTDLKAFGDVIDAASREPVAITEHRKARYVLMSIREYEKRFRKDARKSYAVEEMPDAHLEMLTPHPDQRLVRAYARRPTHSLIAMLRESRLSGRCQRIPPAKFPVR